MKNMKQDVFNTILKIAEETGGTKAPKDIDFDTNISTVYYYMYLDSLDAIEIIMKLEKHYGISIPDTATESYTNKTFDEFCGFICSLIAPQKQKMSFFQKIKQHFQNTK